MLYADHNATTPLAPEVLEAMTACLKDHWGNPSASYRFGAELRERIEEARYNVASLIDARPSEVIFTSGATEANVTAIEAAARAGAAGQVVVTTSVEHPSVLEKVKQLQRQGARVTFLGVSSQGELSLDELREALEAGPALVSVMWANNETGVVFPVEQVGQLCVAKSVPFHCDAVQAVGKIPVSVDRAKATYLTLSGHKIGGPKGVGALYCRAGSDFVPLIPGGHQQAGRRGGTENVAGIVGLGVAAKLVGRKLQSLAAHVLALRTEFERMAREFIPAAIINGAGTTRLPNTTSLTLPGINADALLLLLDQEGICASSGSACLADSEEPSHVIQAMAGKQVVCREVIRVSFGPGNSVEEAHHLALVLNRAVAALSAECPRASDL